jgi:hypothetical protein
VERKRRKGMTGIRFVTDDKGRKVAVQIDLTKHRELWEDIQDVLVSRSRRHEKGIPLDKVKAELDRELGRRLASLDRGEHVDPAKTRARLKRKSKEHR